MPLAALTPVLNDLLHKGGSAGNTSSTATHPSLTPNTADAANPNESYRQGSLVLQSTNVINPLSNEENDVSIK